MLREFRQETRTKKVNRWQVKVEGDQVSVRDGHVGGKMKMWSATTMESVNIGKANEKTAEEAALEEAERRILNKIRKGYREVNLKTGKFLQFQPKQEDTLTHFQDLPQNLRFYKPLNSMNAYLQKMMDERKAWWLRKRDGNMHMYVIDEKMRHRMYSSTTAWHQKDEPGVELINRFPQVEMAFTQMDFLQPKTIFLGEICQVAAGGHADPDEGFDIENLEYVSGICRGLTDYSLAKQKEEGELGFCIWDIAFWGGDCLLQIVPSCDRFGKMKWVAQQDPTGFVTFPEIAYWDEERGVVGVESPTGPFDLELEETPDRELEEGEVILDTPEKMLLALAKEHGWEGWVVVDPKSTFDDRAYNFRGKAERPKYSAKLKPKFEADFIVRWDPDNGIGKWGKGKKSGGVGSAQAYLWDPEAQEEREIALVGGGLKEDDVFNLADPSLYPQVWAIEFTSWTDKGSLQFPEFLRVRDDKELHECTIDQNPAWRSE